jgi:hypothetical protein
VAVDGFLVGLRLTAAMTHNALSIAYHEAGHAVVGRYFGYEIGDVCIRLDDHSGGADVADGGLDGRLQSLIALAGRVAQTRAGYEPAHNGAWLGDMAVVLRIVSDMTGLDFGHDGFKDAYFDLKHTLMSETEELVKRPAIWAAIEAVALVLAERHTIDGATAMAIIDPLLNDRPNED